MSKVKFEVANGINVAETNVAGELVRVEKGKPFETDDPKVIDVLDSWDAVCRASSKSKDGDA